MDRLFPDTQTETAAILIEMFRRASPAKKMEMVGQMNRAVKELTIAGLRARFPNDSPARIQRKLADILLGPELAEKAYGPID